MAATDLSPKEQVAATVLRPKKLKYVAATVLGPKKETWEKVAATVEPANCKARHPAN